jgi:hypothetical protein
LGADSVVPLHLPSPVMAATSVLSFTPSSPWPSARFSRAHLCSPSIAAVAKDTFLWPGVLLHCWHLQIPCELAGPRLTVVHGYRAAPSSLPVASSISVVIASPCSLGRGLIPAPCWLASSPISKNQRHQLASLLLI